MIKKAIKKIVNMSIPLNKKVIVFESLNDFDCNSGAIYNYMIDQGLNKKYKIIWLLKNMNNDIKIKPKNVYSMSFFGEKKLHEKFLLKRAKYLVWDNVPIEKTNKKQISIYLTHGFPAIKNVKGIINIPDSCNYFLITNKNLESHARKQFSVSSKTKFIYAGLPRNDYLLSKNNEIEKLTKEKYKKVIIWMPTFRKAKNSNRNDSKKKFKLGIPLLSSIEEIKQLNNLLKSNNSLLIIKIHNGQDTSIIKINSQSNIIIMTSETEKKLKINLYKLLANTDALLTDYSSVAYDYLLMNKPIGYIVDDIKDYKLGFAFENITEYMPGTHIETYNQLLDFIDNIFNNVDEYKKERKKVLNKINQFQDNKNQERIFKLIEGGKLK